MGKTIKLWNILKIVSENIRKKRLDILKIGTATIIFRRQRKKGQSTRSLCSLGTFPIFFFGETKGMVLINFLTIKSIILD